MTEDPDEWPMWICFLIFLALLLGIYQKRKAKDEDF